MHTRPVLDSTTLQRLVQLGLLLRDALVQANDREPLGRQRALILLDGACEYAIGLSMDELGLKLEQVFHKNLSTLQSELADDWNQAGLEGIREMHELRNAAQHRGTIQTATS
jgi:hypothetical protein